MRSVQMVATYMGAGSSSEIDRVRYITQVTSLCLKTLT